MKCEEAVAAHRAAVHEAYGWPDMENMIAAFDVANERLWDAVLERSEQ